MKRRRLRWRIWWKNFRARKRGHDLGWGDKRWKTLAVWRPIPIPDHPTLNDTNNYHYALDELAVNIKNHARNRCRQDS